MPVVGEVGVLVLAAPAPVLIVDTCSMLNVMEAPHSGIEGVDTIKNANIVLGYLESNPPKCHLILPSVVNTELNNQIDGAGKHTGKSCRKIINQAEAYQQVATIVTGNEMDVRLEDHSVVADKVQEMVSNLIDRSILVSEEECYLAEGVRRSGKSLLPARKGTSVADSVIFAEALALCKLLVGESYDQPLMLLSSNTRDFDPERNPDEEARAKLKVEYSDAGLKYASDWGRAVHELGI